MTASASAPERVLQRLDWTVVRRLDGLLQGDYRSLFRGNGVDFADLREYEYGDDIRHIDWNVTARMDTPYVREFLEDREITAWFLLDLSPSVDFGSVEAERLKRSVLVDVVTTLARVLTRHGNRVGRGVLRVAGRADDPGAGWARPGAAAHQRPAGASASRCRAVHRPRRRCSTPGRRWIKGRSLVFVISDFISAPGWERALQGLTRRHEVIAIRLYDRRERELPDVGPMLMDDAETGEQLYVDTHDPGSGGGSRRPATRARRSWRPRSGAPGWTPFALATDDDLVGAIVRMAARRKRSKR